MKKDSRSQILLSAWLLLASLMANFDSAASTAIVVSVPDQKLTLVRNGERMAQYKISTSKFGLGDRHRSYSTPLGRLEIAERIGAGLPAGAVLKGRRPTGEVLGANARGRDPIVTRILCLRGLEPRNENTHERAIYIHGTPVERTLGKPDSWGCIRMRSEDVVELFDNVSVGTSVEIVNEPMRRMLPGVLAATREGNGNSETADASSTSSPRNFKTLASQAPAERQEPEPQASGGSSGGSRLDSGKFSSTRRTFASSSSYSSSTSIVDLPSLGGVQNLDVSQRQDPGDRRSAFGLSLSW